MIDWTQAYTVDWRLVEVNQDTWASGTSVPYVQSVSISRDCTDDYPLLETASIKMDGSVERLKPGWYRVEGLFTQNAHMERIPIMTMLCESTKGTRNRNLVSLDVDGLSVLQPAKERNLLAGTYVPKGANGPKRAAEYLEKCIAAPVVVHGSFTLDDPLVLDADISYVRAAWTIIDAGGWCMQVHGDGTVHIMEKPSQPDLSLDQAHASLLRPSVSFDENVESVPNHYVAVDGSQIAEAWNDDPESFLSTVSRKRTIDMVDRSPIRINGESLNAYANRKLEEESTIVKTYDYDRNWWPDVYPFSTVRGSIPESGLVTDMRVLSQSFECANGITVSETSGVIEKGYVA